MVPVGSSGGELVLSVETIQLFTTLMYFFPIPPPLVRAMWRRRSHDVSSSTSERSQWLRCQGLIASWQPGGAKEGLIDSLQEATSFMLPTPALNADDCLAMVLAVAQSVPAGDAATCPLGLEVLDRVIRSTALHLTPRNVDSLLGFLLKVMGACGPQPAPGGSSSSTPAGAARAGARVGGGSSSAAAAPPPTLGPASRVLALRITGCILYEHSERCIKWHEQLHRVLVPLLQPPRFPPRPAAAAPSAAAAALAALAAAAAATAAAATASSALPPPPPPPPPPSSSLTPLVPASEDILSAALVAVGNLVLKGGAKSKERHGALFHPTLRVLGSAAALPASTLGEVEYSGRVLSSALRALLAMVRAGDAAVAECVTRSSEDLLRTLQTLCRFGLGCEALVQGGRGRAGGGAPVPAAAAATAAAVAASRSVVAAAVHVPNVGATLEEEEEEEEEEGEGEGEGEDAGSEASGQVQGGGCGSEEEAPKAPAAAGATSPLLSTPARRAAAAAAAAAAALDDDRGSAHSTASASTRSRARWQQPGALASGGGSGWRSGSSWYTASDSEGEEEEGGGGPGGGSVGYTGGAGGGAKARRLVPLRVRVTSLHTLAAVARLCPRAVQSRWDLFLPQVQGSHPKPYSPSLLTAMLHDPSLRVQEAAAGSLAALVEDAPLDKWIALPPVHLAAHSLAVAAAASAAAGGGAGSGAGEEGASPQQHPAARTFTSSLSEKTCAMVEEAHKALNRALKPYASYFAAPGGGGSAPLPSPTPSLAQLMASQAPPLNPKRTGLVVALLKAAAALMAVTPYDRLASRAGRREVRMLSTLCTHTVALLHSTSPLVSVAALHCMASVFSNPAAVEIASGGGGGVGAQRLGGLLPRRWLWQQCSPPVPLRCCRRC